MRRTTVPTCTTLTRETRIWTEWETCVITALWSIIPIRCVDAECMLTSWSAPLPCGNNLDVSSIFLSSSGCSCLSAVWALSRHVTVERVLRAARGHISSNSHARGGGGGAGPFIGLLTKPWAWYYWGMGWPWGVYKLSVHLGHATLRNRNVLNNSDSGGGGGIKG